MEPQLKRFRIPFETINDCTKNFDKENLIGKGGYGNVYKGILSWTDHKNLPVAVKRLDETGFQGNKEFYTEITMLSQYRHKNIIALVGFCDEGKEMIVVYEYASRGSLDNYLTNGKMLDQLSWKRRLKICIGIASALEYLHNHVAAEHRVIHRDMKSSNILLDEKWKPKLSDFGLSRIGLLNQQNSYVITTVAGTHGYCDPQYKRTGILTKESDVYSFGVVLFEVLCGRLACVVEYKNEKRFLPHLVRTYYNKGELEKIVDYRIRDHIKATKMIKFTAIAFQCLQKTREERPKIHEVVLQLKNIKDTQAYTLELEAEVAKLKELNHELIKKQLETCGNGNENQDQPSHNSVLESQFEDDDHDPITYINEVCVEVCDDINEVCDEICDDVNEVCDEICDKLMKYVMMLKKYVMKYVMMLMKYVMKYVMT